VISAHLCSVSVTAKAAASSLLELFEYYSNSNYSSNFLITRVLVLETVNFSQSSSIRL